MDETKAARKRKFRVKLANGFGKWTPMPDDYVGGWTQYSERPDALERPGLLDNHFGKRCEYGALFTYLFRRFGLPNRPSDDYKEIAAYTLATPLKDLLLVVAPSVSEWPRLSFRFLVTRETYAKLTHEPREQWTLRMVAWCEAQGLPAWMNDWLTHWRAMPGAGRYPLTGDVSDWRFSISEMHYLHLSLNNRAELQNISPERRALLEQVADYAARIEKEYGKIDVDPDHLTRPNEWREWPDDDLWKPYYAAAAVTLEDLSTPVRIRDSQINAHGLVDDKHPLARTVLEEPEVSGGAWGYYINKHPGAAMELLALADDAGRGNLAAGVKKVVNGYQSSRSPKQAKSKAGE